MEGEIYMSSILRKLAKKKHKQQKFLSKAVSDHKQEELDKMSTTSEDIDKPNPEEISTSD